MWAGAVRGWGRCPPPPLARLARQAGRHAGRIAPRAGGGGGPNEAVPYACAYSVVYLSMRRQRCAGRVAADAARGGPRPRPAHGQPGRGRRLCAALDLMLPGAGMRWPTRLSTTRPWVPRPPASSRGGGALRGAGPPVAAAAGKLAPATANQLPGRRREGGFLKALPLAGRPPARPCTSVIGAAAASGVPPSRPPRSVPVGGCRLSFPLLLLLPAIARR